MVCVDLGRLAYLLSDFGREVLLEESVENVRRFVWVAVPVTGLFERFGLCGDELGQIDL